MIAREKLCASVLIIPRSKSSLVEALHERGGHGRSWSSMTGNRNSLERKGRRRRAKGGAWLAVGVGALGGEGQPAAVLASCFCVLPAL
jgi:hypothetical protein